MNCRTGFVLLCLTAAQLVFAQSPPPENAGVTAEWDVRKQMADLANGVRKLVPLLEKANPTQWMERGASSTYIKQLNSAKASVQQLVAATDRLAERPENLTAALDAYFQMERMELLVNSFRDGVRKYQSGPLADEFNRVSTANSNDKARLKQHILDLANMREQECKTANEEAQRCRGILTRQAPQAAPERKTFRTKNRQPDRN